MDRGEFWHALFDDGPCGVGAAPESREAFSLLRDLLRQLLEAARSTSRKRVVHSDMKPENCLVEYVDGALTLKLCDFGGAFVVDPEHKVSRVSSATPEYLAPECVVAAGSVHKAPVHAIDMFAIGMIFFEIASGFPLWFPFNSRVVDPEHRRDNKKRRSGWVRGACAVPNRDGAKIARRQAEIAKDVPAALKRMPGKGISRDADAMDLLTKLLCTNAHKRISPDDALTSGPGVSFDEPTRPSTVACVTSRSRRHPFLKRRV